MTRRILTDALTLGIVAGAWALILASPIRARLLRPQD